MTFPIGPRRNERTRLAVNDAYQAINNLIVSYVELLDNGQFDEAVALFEQATVKVGGSDFALHGLDAKALLTDMVQRYEGIPATKHLVTNIVITVDHRGERATSRSYYTALQALPELPLQPILAGRWHDTFGSTDGRWHFTERLIYNDLVGDISHHLGGNPQ